MYTATLSRHLDPSPFLTWTPANHIEVLEADPDAFIRFPQRVTIGDGPTIHGCRTAS